MKKSIFALVGAALILASGFVFTGCANDEEEESGEATMTVKLTFDDFTAEKVVVKYGDEKNPDTTYEIVTATVASDKKSATFTAKDSKTNADGWSQIISVSCYASASDTDALTVVATNSDAYWEFAEDTTKTIAYKLKQDETMTLSLTFTDFTADTVTVTYGYDDNYTTVDATVAEGGASATVALSNAYANSVSWMCVKEVVATKDSETLSIETSASNMWFEFKTGETQSFTYQLKADSTVVKTADYTATGSNAVFVEASSLSSLSIGSIVIEATSCDWTNIASGASWWICASTSSDATDATNLNWVTNENYKVTITDATFISSAKTNGIYINAESGMTCTLTVSYTAE